MKALHGMVINVIEETINGVDKDGNGIQIKAVVLKLTNARKTNNGMVLDVDANKVYSLLVVSVKHAQLEQFSMDLYVLLVLIPNIAPILILSGMAIAVYAYLDIGHWLMVNVFLALPILIGMVHAVNKQTVNISHLQLLYDYGIFICLFLLTHIIYL